MTFAGSQPAFAGESVVFRFVLENQNPFARSQLRFGLKHREDICDALEPEQRYNVTVRVAAPHRGRLALPRLLISTRFPLGLFRAWAWIYMDVGEIVYPQPAASATLVSSGRGGLASDGRRQPGDDDFSGLRDYRLGDPPKRIAWKVLARSGEMLITDYQGGATDLVWLDWHDYPHESFEDRLSLLARLVLDAEASGCAWGLRLPTMEISPGKGAAHQHQCLKALALFEAQPETGGPRCAGGVTNHHPTANGAAKHPPRRVARSCGSLASIFLCGAPHFIHVHPWVPLVVLLILAWRIIAAAQRKPLPGAFMRVTLTLLAFIGVLFSYRQVTGLSAGSALLLIMAALKLLETRGHRDRAVVMFICYFLIFATFLREQAIWSSALPDHQRTDDDDRAAADGPQRSGIAGADGRRLFGAPDPAGPARRADPVPAVPADSGTVLVSADDEQQCRVGSVR